MPFEMNDKDRGKKLVVDIIGMLYLRQFLRICCVAFKCVFFSFNLFASANATQFGVLCVHIFMVHRHKVLSSIKHPANTDRSLYCACTFRREVQPANTEQLPQQLAPIFTKCVHFDCRFAFEYKL